MSGVSLTQLKFENDFVTSLPGDKIRDRSSRLVNGVCYSLVDPTPVTDPNLLAWSSDLAETLGIVDASGEDAKVAAAVLGGNQTLAGMCPYAARYGGHQFGHWAGQLGDGRAITLGEMRDPNNRMWELQLKGAGPTPYSRRADGRAVLRSSLREFLCSEAMHHLGIPSTRALSLVATGELVSRDMFYDGNPKEELGAITCRVAPSFIRFGNFEILADAGEIDLLRKLSDFVVSRHFPNLSGSGVERYGLWFDEICRRTARLIVEWLRVGFVHGVMNTDNMSILGLTVDYGPYGWLEGYDLAWTPNTTDAQGRRYCYGRQPEIGYWNLQRLGEALIPLLGDRHPIERVKLGLAEYERVFVSEYHQMLASKLGLDGVKDRGDIELAQGFLQNLELIETDMTIAFRKLMDLDLQLSPNNVTWDAVCSVESAFYEVDSLSPSIKHQWVDWFRRYLNRLQSDGLTTLERKSRMTIANPNFVLRNYLVQDVIDEMTSSGSTSKLSVLMNALKRPYDNFDAHPALIAKRPEWARHRPGCSALSCSS